MKRACGGWETFYPQVYDYDMASVAQRIFNSSGTTISPAGSRGDAGPVDWEVLKRSMCGASELAKARLENRAGGWRATPAAAFRLKFPARGSM